MPFIKIADRVVNFDHVQTIHFIKAVRPTPDEAGPGLPKKENEGLTPPSRPPGEAYPIGVSIRLGKNDRIDVMGQYAVRAYSNWLSMHEWAMLELQP